MLTCAMSCSSLNVKIAQVVTELQTSCNKVVVKHNARGIQPVFAAIILFLWRHSPPWICCILSGGEWATHLTPLTLGWGEIFSPCINNLSFTAKRSNQSVHHWCCWPDCLFSCLLCCQGWCLRLWSGSLKMTTWTSWTWLTNWLNSALWYKREFTNCNFWWFSQWLWLSWIFHPCLRLWLVFAWNFRTAPSRYWKVCIPRNLWILWMSGFYQLSRFLVWQSLSHCKFLLCRGHTHGRWKSSIHWHWCGNVGRSVSTEGGHGKKGLVGKKCQDFWIPRKISGSIR